MQFTGTPKPPWVLMMKIFKNGFLGRAVIVSGQDAVGERHGNLNGFGKNAMTEQRYTIATQPEQKPADIDGTSAARLTLALAYLCAVFLVFTAINVELNEGRSCVYNRSFSR